MSGTTTLTLSTIGAIAGGAAGFALAGPQGAAQGAQLGAAFGVQTSQHIPAEDEKENILIKALTKSADVWAKLFLIGYAIQIAYASADIGAKFDISNCIRGSFSTPLCISNFFTTLSLQVVVFAGSLALGREIFNMTCRKP